MGLHGFRFGFGFKAEGTRRFPGLRRLFTDTVGIGSGIRVGLGFRGLGFCPALALALALRHLGAIFVCQPFFRCPYILPTSPAFTTQLLLLCWLEGFGFRVYGLAPHDA